MDIDQNKTDQYGWYNTPQDQIESIMVAPQETVLDRRKLQSEYLLPDDLNMSISIPEIQDTDTAPLQDDNITQDASRTAMGSPKDEDNYNLARNSGFPANFATILPERPEYQSNDDEIVQKMTSQECKRKAITSKRNMMILTLMIVVFSLGGVLAYSLTGHSGTTTLCTYTNYHL